MPNIKIDPEFEALIPPLREDERALLEESIAKQGLRDQLTAWQENGDTVLLDGHNRYRILEKLCKNGGVSLQTRLYGQVRYERMETRDEAIAWIINNQLGRRNLSELDRVKLAEQKREILEKQAHLRKLATQNNNAAEVVNLPPQVDSGKVRDKLAAEVGVSGKTYDSLAKVATNGTSELQDAVREKKIGASTAAAISTLPAEEQAAIATLPKKEIVAKAKEIKPQKPQCCMCGKTGTIATTWVGDTASHWCKTCYEQKRIEVLCGVGRETLVKDVKVMPPAIAPDAASDYDPYTDDDTDMDTDYDNPDPDEDDYTQIVDLCATIVDSIIACDDTTDPAESLRQLCRQAKVWRKRLEIIAGEAV